MSLGPERRGARIRVNGSPRQVAPGTTVADLIREVAEGATAVAVALNRAVVPRSLWTATELSDGDTVEILAAVQGG